ncbi:hypothetical protein DCC85_14350 [Paenibacillus sp. CAA11]|nr:hypothetical protein DCC85_14350 [Paenibacillus sp. CAA11]
MKTLNSDIDLFIAALTQDRVTVVEKDTGKIADYGGPVDYFSFNAVRIGGVYYTRAANIFRVNRT